MRRDRQHQFVTDGPFRTAVKSLEEQLLRQTILFPIGNRRLHAMLMAQAPLSPVSLAGLGSLQLLTLRTMIEPPGSLAGQ